MTGKNRTVKAKVAAPPVGPVKSPVELLAEYEHYQTLVNGLPHLSGFPWYRWAKDFFDSTNKQNFLCAANQISKSTTQQRKMIDWATDVSKWKKLWPGLLPGQKPNQFWYFFPTAEVWTAEFESKIKPDLMPRGPYEGHPQYGWKAVYDKGLIKRIDFNSGVSIYCKTYSQKPKDLQSGSVHALFLDEEPPIIFLPELQARLRATSGYMHAVMTPTLGQEYWRRVFQPRNPEEEIFPNAWKRQVSLYDSQKYIDGTKSRWNDKRIEEIIAESPTEAEVQRRVFGKFVKSDNLRFESFDMDRNTMSPQPVPKQWAIYGAVDPGSGGKSGHPAAIVFMAVRPDYREAWVFKAWRGDGIPTANPDILRKFREMRGSLLMTSQVYDYKDKDFYLVALSEGETFTMANKKRGEGYGLLNSLWKLGMLKIFRGDPELEKLIAELLTVPAIDDSRALLNDLSDALRYDVMDLPWDFAGANLMIKREKFMDAPPDPRSDEQIARDEMLKSRRDFVLNKGPSSVDSDEADYWNSLNGS
jgi:hypothetical protein